LIFLNLVSNSIALAYPDSLVGLLAKFILSEFVLLPIFLNESLMLCCVPSKGDASPSAVSLAGFNLYRMQIYPTRQYDYRKIWTELSMVQMFSRDIRKMLNIKQLFTNKTEVQTKKV